jgi:hypothetical protein
MASERRARDGTGVACAAALALLAAGGAAAAPGGLLLGAPGPAGIAFAAAAALLAWRLEPAQRSLALGLLPFLVGLPLAPWLPGPAAWTGPPLAAALAGVLLLQAWPRLHGPPARRLLLPCLLLVYGLAAWRVQQQVGPEGDEPHYLMVADSLLRDGDLALEEDYSSRRYEAFYRKGALQPHYRVRGARGEIYSLHAIGLSLLLLPGYALGGYPGASLCMAVLLALLVDQLRGLAEAWLGEAAPATAVAWIVGLSPPLLHYAGLVFTEVPAALLLCVALRLGHAHARLRGARLLGLIAALGFLPWLNVRYAPLAAIALAYALAGARARLARACLAAGALLSVLALALYHQWLYGFFDPRRVYGSRPELSLGQLPEGLPGLLLDQEFGLLVYAPILALALPGLLRLARERAHEGAVAAALLACVVLLAGSWHMWRGGWNPPARFLVPAMPVLAAGLAVALRPGVGAAAGLLAGWSLWVGALGALEPRLVHRDRDGTAPLFRAYSGAEEWTRLLPAYVLADPDRHRLAAVWGTALAAASLASSRFPSAAARSVAVTSAAAIGFAGVASSLTGAVTGGRDAARVVGRPALELPGPSVFLAAPAVWTPRSLAWGPAFEPHRYPEGAAVAERVALRAGSYRLTVLGEALGPTAPDLLLVPDKAAGALASIPLQPIASGWQAGFETDGQTPVTLRLRGGSALIVKELRLEASTFPRAPGLNR